MSTTLSSQEIDNAIFNYLGTGQAVVSVAVSNAVLRVFGSASWTGTALTTNSATGRYYRLANNDPTNAAYILITPGTSNSGVSNTAFSRKILPHADTIIFVPKLSDVLIVRDTTSTSTVTAEELLS